MADLIYKLRKTEPFNIDADGVFIAAGTAGLFSNLPMLWQWSRVSERVKLAIKIIAGRSVFFGIRSSERLVSSGVMAVGYCRHYEVEQGSVVIGTIETDKEMRGRGLATRAIKGAMNAMIGRGYTLFYIDTQKDNAAMQRSIDKIGFAQITAGK